MNNQFTACIESYPDFPKDGVLFWDFTPLTARPELFRQAICAIRDHVKEKPLTAIVAIEAKGFILGGALAYEMGLPLIAVRKPNLIPGAVDREEFKKEYGYGEYQIKKGVLKSADRVLIVYDILAEAGATRAAINLVERSGAQVEGCAFVTELGYLQGRAGLEPYDVFSLVRITERPL